jgi:hypothetical protein
MLFSDPHGRARLLELVQGGSPLALLMPTFTEPTWANELGAFAGWVVVGTVALFAVAAAARWRDLSAWTLAAIAVGVAILGGAVLNASPSSEIRAVTARRGDLDVLWRFDGRRFRTLDYTTLRRAAPDRVRDLTTIVFEAPAPAMRETTYVVGPLSVPPGRYDAVIQFTNGGGAEADARVMTAPATTFAHATGLLANPTRLPFDLPVGVRRLTIQVSGAQLMQPPTVTLVPTAIVPASARDEERVRTVEQVAGRPGAYLVYTDEHAYPENGVFWSRGTSATRVLIAPAGAARMTLTLSSGPMNGVVALTMAGRPTTVQMRAGEIQVVSFDLLPAQRLVPLTVQSSVMFRPAEVDPRSTDMRGLGCQVRVALE